MTLVLVGTDAWADLGGLAELLVRADPLSGPGYRVRVEVGADTTTGLLHVRCLSPVPAGFWLRTPLVRPPFDPDGPGEHLSVIDTQQFRTDPSR